MRNCCSSPQVIPAPARHTLDQSLSMDSRHGSSSGAGEGASCSENPAGSSACPPPTRSPLPETVRAHGALTPEASEPTLFGKPELMSSAEAAPTASEIRNPVFSQKMDSNSLKQADSTSTRQEEAGSLRKEESMLKGKAEPGICGKGEPGVVGRVDCTAPREEDSGSLGRGDTACSGKMDVVSPGGESVGSLRKVETISSGKMDPGKENPVHSRSEHSGSTQEGEPVSLEGNDVKPSEKVDPASTKKTDPGFSGKLTPGSSGKTELVSSVTVVPVTSERVNPVCSGIADPAAVGNAEILSSAKEDPQVLGKKEPVSSREGRLESVRMAETVSARQPEGMLPAKTDPSSSNSTGPSGRADPVSLRDSELVSPVKPEHLSSGQAERVSLVKTETLSSGKEDPRSSRRVDHTTPTGNIKTSQKGNPESSRKTDPVSSSSGDTRSLGTWGSLSVAKAEVTEGKGDPQSLEKASLPVPEKAGPLALSTAGSASQGKAETLPSGEVGSMTLGKTVPASSGKTALVSPGKVDLEASERAEGIPELKAPEKGNPGNSTRVDTRASGSTEPKSGVKVATQPPGATSPGKAEAPSLQKEQPQLSEKKEPSRKVDPTASVEPVSLGKTDSASPSPRKAESQTSAKISPQAPDKATSSFRQSDGTPHSSAQPRRDSRSIGTLPEPEPSASTSQKDLAAAVAHKSPGAEGAALPPGPRTRDNFTKAPSWDAGAPPPREDAGTQAGTQACVSVAVSPMSPQDGAGGPAFSFQAAPRAPSPAPGPPSRRDAGLQVSLGAAETRSVATGPMTPQAAAPPAAPPVFPEVRVRPGSVLAAAMAPQEAAEPVREVSWDEKGMTWEVYGASMEVEVLGMAIQKHLERQIEEHGRQGAPAPPPAVRAGPGRAGSVRTAPAEGAPKRPPGLFRALLQSVRRPRCCSRAGPTAE
ncbi:G protein-regulated inducer of neurite outgrowth 1 [Apodemus sylvaticus]|uniref:G protein-regulated inducer of neurite outgrowth 1 n=1 Tax=Apodemus sylvaticus TaxID=10129 RepID=UPI002244382F|nr:G protein-regulated inducer of neurite outgrowth 1 [Apodemus sylvaticus]